jgi:hypothetical protein
MRTLHPYPVLSGDVKLALAEPYADGEPARGAWRDLDGRTIDLTSLEKGGWATATIGVELVGPPSELEDRRRGGGAPQAHVLVHCGRTNARQSVTLVPDATGSRWRGEITLSRAFWFGRIEVSAHITDLVAGERRLIGDAERWAIDLDDLPNSPLRGSLTVLWRNFELKDVEPAFLSASKGEPYFHFIDPDQPILFLNFGFEGLEPMLRDGRRPQAEQALHDQVRSTIATKFFLAAANAALSGVRQEPDQPPEWPDSAWQRELLEVLFHRAFPRLSPNDALAHVIEMRRTEQGAGTVQNDLIGAVDHQVGSSRFLRRGIQLMGLDTDQAANGDSQ